MTSCTDNHTHAFTKQRLHLAQSIRDTGADNCVVAIFASRRCALRSSVTDLLCASVAGIALFASCVAADAAPLDVSGLAPDFAFIQHARAASTDATSLGLGWQLGEPLRLIVGNISVYLETSVGRWSTVGERGRDVAWITQLGLTPALRFQPRSQSWFAELGVGANYLGPIYRTDQKRFSAAFNFGDHVGIGWKFAESQRQELMLRLQHFSNAGIRQPNPGENFWQLRYSRPW